MKTKQHSTLSWSVANTNWQTLPRLIKRDLPFHQSKNKVNVKNRYGTKKRQLLWIVRYDWFHVFLRWKTSISLLVLLFTWTFIILIFALIYMKLDAVETKPECKFGVKEDQPVDFTGAFAFSLETCTTVGYGLPKGLFFFDHCYGLQVAIYFQMAFSLMFNAFLIAFFYNRIGRVESRSIQVLFSEKAVISKDESGKMVLDVQVYDADSRYPVVEAHARLYVVHPSSRSDCVQLRVVRPNDELGATLLSSVPSRITHHIDIYSPLMPPSFRSRKNVVRSYGLNLREVDSFTTGRTGCICPVCGDAFPSIDLLWIHIRYNQLQENYCKVPPDTAESHLILGRQEDHEKPPKPTFNDLQQFWSENHMEVIAVVEGIDPLTSGTFQALQSYQQEDIVFGGSFAKCFTDDNIVDFDLFHCVVDASDDNYERDDASYASYRSNIVDVFKKDKKDEDALNRSERTDVRRNTSVGLNSNEQFFEREEIPGMIRTDDEPAPVDEDINSEL